mgnify:CR=1 FL=1
MCQCSVPLTAEFFHAAHAADGQKLHLGLCVIYPGSDVDIGMGILRPIHPSGVACTFACMLLLVKTRVEMQCQPLRRVIIAAS